jgi:hypothetical protein
LASGEHLKRAIHRLSSALTIASAYGSVQRGRLKARTCAEYSRILNTYILPEFGSTPIGAVDAARVERFAASLLAPPPARSSRRKSLSPATFKRVWHVFGGFARTPCARVRCRRPRSTAPR